MFDKLEFSDLNKYLVSIGTILVGLSFLLPYLYLRENFGIIVSKADYNSYTLASQEIIQFKQRNVLLFQNIIYCITVIIFLIGLTLIGFGIYRWNKRQLKINEKFDKEIWKLEIEIAQMTSSEKERKIEEEIVESGESDVLQSTKSEIDFVKTNYQNIEAIIKNAFHKNYSKYFKILNDVKLEGNYFDIILQSKSTSRLDRIIEIKYFNNLNRRDISDLIEKFGNAVTIYSYAVRKARGYFYVVYNDNHITDEQIKMLSVFPQRYREYIHVHFIKLSELGQFEPPKNII